MGSTGSSYGNKMGSTGSSYGNKMGSTGSSYGNKLGDIESTGHGYGNKMGGRRGLGERFPEMECEHGMCGSKHVGGLNPFLDESNKYDMDKFSHFRRTNPIFSHIGKHFENPSISDESHSHYNLPTETVELVKKQENIIETVRELMKYAHNLPVEVRTQIEKEFNLTHVIKFLLRVYYQIPQMKKVMVPYYNIPTEVLTELKTTMDLKKVIKFIIQKYVTLPTEERQFYAHKYFDIKPVIRTLLLCYYGVPKEFVQKLEMVVQKESFSNEIGSNGFVKEELRHVLQTIAANRHVLTVTEKHMFDK
jgi:hypothetical protein